MTKEGKSSAIFHFSDMLVFFGLGMLLGMSLTCSAVSYVRKSQETAVEQTMTPSISASTTTKDQLGE